MIDKSMIGLLRACHIGDLQAYIYWTSTLRLNMAALVNKLVLYA